MKKKFLVMAILFCGCATGQTVVTDAVTGAIISAPPVEAGAYFSILPWVLVACALAVFLFGWYTPSPRDNVPCTVIAGSLMAFSMAVAKNGERMADLATWACYASAVACIVFYVKGHIQKHYLNKNE